MKRAIAPRPAYGQLGRWGRSVMVVVPQQEGPGGPLTVHFVALIRAGNTKQQPVFRQRDDL